MAYTAGDGVASPSRLELSLSRQKTWERAAGCLVSPACRQLSRPIGPWQPNVGLGEHPCRLGTNSL
jgi:hypothetical protein